VHRFEQSRFRASLANTFDDIGDTLAVPRRNSSPPDGSPAATPSPVQELGDQLVLYDAPFVIVGDQLIHCPPAGWRIVRLLLDKPRHSCSLVDVVEDLHGDPLAETRAGKRIGSRQIQNHLGRLRKLLRPHGIDFAIIAERVFLFGPGDPRKKLAARRPDGGSLASSG
jgi:hypothetical protein